MCTSLVEDWYLAAYPKVGSSAGGSGTGWERALLHSGDARMPSPAVDPLPLTCIPQMRTPRQAEVLCAHFVMWRAFFSSDASSPCCLVPIFRSRMQGYLYCDTTFSSNKNPGHTKLRKIQRTLRPLPHRRQAAHLQSWLEIFYSEHYSFTPIFFITDKPIVAVKNPR